MSKCSVGPCSVVAMALFAMSLTTDSVAQSTNDTGVGLAVGIGQSRIQDEDGPGDTFDGSDTGYNIDLEWRFIEYLAIGINYVDFGKDTEFFNGEDTTIEVTGNGYYARGYLPLNDRFMLHATLGELSYRSTVNGFQPGFLLPFAESATAFGAGADFSLSKHWSLRFDHRWYDGDNREEGAMTTLGIRWQY
ncbi:MAG: outer membrane beta-barrel protein [Pseudomonadota bacterium]